ncbi:MAG: DnaD domain protein [Ruminococcaceae bacterium]|nr:DnaD domain protein [Oscillospiraceae bacterium]
MNLNIEFGNGVISLPEKALNVLQSASSTEIKLLVYIASDKSVRENFSHEDAALMLGVNTDDIANALKFLVDSGLVSGEISREKADISVRVKKAGERSVTVIKAGNDAPTYTGAEIEAIFSQKSDIRLLVDECQRIFGKMFTLMEINRVISLADYYRFDNEYVVTLFQYAAKIGKPSVPYVDKMGRELYNQGIVTLDSLEKKIKQLEDFSTVEGFVRRLFGMGERKLTSKEAKFVEMWSQESYPQTMIELAYEISVNNTGAPSMPYINKTLTNWREAGYRTTEEVVKSIDKYRQEKQDKRDQTTRKMDDPMEEAILSSSKSRLQKILKENNS